MQTPKTFKTDTVKNLMNPPPALPTFTVSVISVTKMGLPKRTQHACFPIKVSLAALTGHAAPQVARGTVWVTSARHMSISPRLES